MVIMCMKSFLGLIRFWLVSEIRKSLNGKYLSLRTWVKRLARRTFVFQSLFKSRQTHEAKLTQCL